MKEKEGLIRDLLNFKYIIKFGKNKDLFYSGISDVRIKADMNILINNSIEKFIIAIKNNGTNVDFQRLILDGVNQFDYLNLDTQDREQVCLYYQELMDIINLESSGGTLNKWMYGFDF